MRSRMIVLCLALPLAAAGCTTMEAQIQSSGTMGKPDADYVATAYQLVQLDTQAGKLAVANAADPRVQQLSGTLMTQADAFTPTLKSAMMVEKVSPPASLPQEEVAQIQALAGLKGAAFDRRYVADELAIHKRAVSVLQKEDAATQDGALRTQVETELPSVRDNLNTLQALSDEYHGKTQG